jgi:hypothetical protein
MRFLSDGVYRLVAEAVQAGVNQVTLYPKGAVPCELGHGRLYGIQENPRSRRGGFGDTLIMSHDGYKPVMVQVRSKGDGVMRILLLGVVAALVGCVSSHVMIGQARPPITPDQVKIYWHPPAHYDEIALLDTSSRNSFSFTAQGKTDAVIDRLKEEAAKLGANGVLLEGVGDQSAGSVSTGYAQATATSNSAYASGIGISGNVMIKKGSGVAIYVAQN